MDSEPHIFMYYSLGMPLQAIVAADQESATGEAFGSKDGAIHPLSH